MRFGSPHFHEPPNPRREVRRLESLSEVEHASSAAGSTAGRSARSPTRTARGEESGFTVLVVLVFLLIMASLAVGNNIALSHLQRELRLVERQQQQHYLAIGTTNAPAAAK